MSRRGSKIGQSLDSDLDCTAECSCQSHASLVLTCVALGNLRLFQHCSSLCGNPWRIADRFGRTPLHVAASRGCLDITRWLLSRKKVAVDTRDEESGWSALHRSVYFGELGSAIALVKYGASLTLRDSDGHTPLSLLNCDRFLFRSSPGISTTDVYTWGSNTNTTLGHAHSRPHPERLELPKHYTITQVVLEKFHSVLLTSEGVVLTCGHGTGGRLGHGSEASVVTPRVVKALKDMRCVAVAAARNHTVFLTHSGQVYTCGLNDAHQLGQGSAPNSAPQNCLTPTPITARILRGRHILGIGAGRYHTAVCTATEVYTFGMNLGQLGYEKTHATQVLPKAVPQINLDPDDSILSLSASHAATACLTRKHRVFVCVDFTVKSLRCGFLEKLSCCLFQVCASLTDRAHLRNTQPEPTKVLLLDSEHKLWYWEPGKKGTLPNTVPELARYRVTHFTLGKNLTIVTEEGEAYTSVAISGQPLQLSRLPSVQNCRALFTDYKTTNCASLQNVYRALDLPTISPPTLTSDLASLLKEGDLPDSVADVNIEVNGQDLVFSAHRYILSSVSPLLSSLLHPSPPTHTLPTLISSHSPSHLSLSGTSPHTVDALLHYIYGAKLRLIPIQDQSCPDSTSGSISLDAELTPDTSFASIDENDLTEMYDRFGNVSSRDNQAEDQLDEINLSNGFFTSHVGQSTPKKKRQGRGKSEGEVVTGGGCEVVKEIVTVGVRRELQALLRLANDLQVAQLKTKLEALLATSQKFLRPLDLEPPSFSLSPSLSPSLCDITIRCSDGHTLHCHKCVLVARSDYFKSMLLMGWRESADGATSLSLPFSHQLLTTVVHFMYTDHAPSVTNSESLEWIVSVLVIADQLLLTRLKDICECELAKKLTLRGVTEVLDVAIACSASQLKRSCFQFIGANAAALLEGRYLDSLSSSCLAELSTTYKEMVPSIPKRVIKFPEPDPSELPESYFLTGDKESVDEEEEEEGGGEGVNRRSPTQDSPSHTPHTSSRHRKKEGRRRKNSHSKLRKAQDRSSMSPSPPPPSPLPSSPTTTVTTSPLLPLSPLSQESTPKAPPDLTTPDPPSSTPRSGQGKRSSRREIERGRGSSGVRGKEKKEETLRKRLLDSYGGEEGAEEGREGGGGGGGGGGTEGGARKKEESLPTRRLTNGVAEEVPHHQQKSVPWGGGRSRTTRLSSPPELSAPPPQPSPPKPAWSRGMAAWSDGGRRGASLREIMAEEEKETEREKSHYKPSSNQLSSSPSGPHPQSHPSHPPLTPHQGTAAVLSRQTSYPPKSAPQNVTQRRHVSAEYGGSAPSSLPQSPPGNPWRMSEMATSPVISLRDLMAEETVRAAEQERRSRAASLSHTSPPTSRGGRVEEKRRAPPAITPRRVSFAEIILSQQKEQEDQQRSQSSKPLSCIQIEEQAILQLEALYKSRDNPDEFITIKRYCPLHLSPSSHLSPSPHPSPTTSPWSTR